MSFDTLTLNIKLINETFLVSSDYFSLFEREVKIVLRNSNKNPERSSIQGKIEFRNIKFHYPSDKAGKNI